jgi:hypothetical protein
VLRASSKRLRRAAQAVLGAALLGLVSATSADDAPPARSREAAPMAAEMVKPGLWRINGIGGGTLVRLDPKGTIVVDSNRAGTYRPLMAAIQGIAKASDPAVRALVLTSTGPDQAGNVGQFIAAEVPVIVEKQAVARLDVDASGKHAAIAKPLVTYDADYLLRVGNAQAEIEHVGRGRTGADSVVYFRDLRAVGVGELFTHGTPEPDCASGGSFAGWAAAITHLLWFDFDVAVPSRGAPVGKPELVAFRAKLQALAQRDGASASGRSGCRPSS